MKTIITNYSFTASNGHITFPDFTPILNRILLITDITQNTVVYQFNKTTKGGTLSGNVLDLVFNTSSFADSDKLQIIYETKTGDPVYEVMPIADGNGNALTSTAGALDINLKSGFGTLATAANQTTANTTLAAINTKITAVDTGNVTVVSSVLASGASTSAKQDTGNTSLASIDSKMSTVALEAGGNLAAIKAKTDNIPALGQALAAASVPIVLTAAQLTTLTPPAAITGFATSTKQSDGSQKTQLVDGSGNVVGSTSNALNINLTNASVAVTGTFYQATQPVSVSSLPLPSGAATSAKQPALGTAGTASTDVITVQGIAGMTALKVDGSAATQPVSGTFWQTTQPVSLASLPALATGSNTIGAISNTAFTANAGTNLNTSLLALESGGNLATIVTNTNKIPSLGQALAAASVPVVLTAAQLTTLTPLSTIATTQSGNWSVRAQDGSGNALTSHAPGSARALDVSIVDGSGNQITSFGGGTQYATGTTQATPTGTLALGYDGAALRALNTDINGNLYEKGAFITSNASASALNADVVPSTDLAGMQSIVLQLTVSATNGTLTFQGSNDNSTWVAYPMRQLTGGNNAGMMSTTSNFGATGTGTATWQAPVVFRYFRARLTGYSSGTATGYFMASTNAVPNVWSAGVGQVSSQAVANTIPGVPIALSDPSSNTSAFTAVANMNNAISNSIQPTNIMAVGLTGVDSNDTRYVIAPMRHADNLAIGTNDKSKPVGVGLYAELDDVSTTTVTENQAALLRLTPNRSLMVEETFDFSYINTAATTTVKASAGFLKSITINTPGTVASTITVYNNTAGSGAVIAVIDSINGRTTFTYNVRFSTGLTIVTTGTIPPDITVSYR